MNEILTAIALLLSPSNPATPIPKGKLTSEEMTILQDSLNNRSTKYRLLWQGSGDGGGSGGAGSGSGDGCAR